MRDKKTQERRRKILGRLIGQKIGPGRMVKLADGWYRLRRGKLVRIPDEWVNKPWDIVGVPRRIRGKWLASKRQSKNPRKVRMRGWGSYPGRVPRDRRPPRAKDGSYVPTMGSGRMRHPNNRSPRHLSQRERRRRDWEDGLL